MVRSVEKRVSREIDWTVSQLAPFAGRIQGRLAGSGVTALIGGGVGVDLLISHYLPGTKLVRHRDIDLYVPLGQRGAALAVLEEMGEVNVYSYENVAHGIVKVEGITVDLFSIAGVGVEARVLDASAARLWWARENNKMPDPRFDISIDPTAEEVSFQRRKYLVLGPRGQLKLLEYRIISRQRDIEAMRRIIG